MTENAQSCRRARRRWPLLAFLVMLSPSIGGAAAPVDVSLPDASPIKSPDASPAVAFLSDHARHHARPGKIRIGRIFSSPAERRRRYADRTPATDAPSTAAHAARVERLEINGAISSNTQGRAVWVNGVAIENSAKFKSAWTDQAGSVWLRDDNHLPRRARPGQAIDPASGAIEDLLPAGSIVRR